MIKRSKGISIGAPKHVGVSRIGDKVVVHCNINAVAYQPTDEEIEKMGIDVRTLDISENDIVYYQYDAIDYSSWNGQSALEELLAEVLDTGCKDRETLYEIAAAFGVTKYEKLVPYLIRTRYSADDEFAIQRKAILGDKAEFEDYTSFVESCKQMVK